jgi:hypothetical protein
MLKDVTHVTELASTITISATVIDDNCVDPKVMNVASVTELASTNAVPTTGPNSTEHCVPAPASRRTYKTNRCP